MNRILVVGDRIIDHYSYCKAVRLCPEAPAPVLHLIAEQTSEGGAALVAANLNSLLSAPEDSVYAEYGSVSHKHRIFADHHLVCRIDRDSQSVLEPEHYWREIQRRLPATGDFVNAVVVSDYGKGAMTPGIASGLVAYCEQNQIPLFVDAKHDTKPYIGCFAIFPNENEHRYLSPDDYKNVIRKVGPIGCYVNGYLVGTKEQRVYDVTGAGDVFLAAFVVAFVESRGAVDDFRLRACARYANIAAGVSVRHLGTHVVSSDELREESDSQGTASQDNASGSTESR